MAMDITKPSSTYVGNLQYCLSELCRKLQAVRRTNFFVPLPQHVFFNPRSGWQAVRFR